jgi:catechol 2,3-dioxygenase-like lactoylglutathione lyase family enzyme
MGAYGAFSCTITDIVRVTQSAAGGRRTSAAPPLSSGVRADILHHHLNVRSRQMETQELHRGRLVDHIQLVVKDVKASKRFYSAVLGALGIPMGGEGEDYFWADELFISSKDSPAAQGTTTGRTHLAFQAKDRAAVERFHSAALAAGGRDNGKPGERPYHPGYYAAFALDPDGNNVEAVFHGPAQRSADSVKITFAA